MRTLTAVSGSQEPESGADGLRYFDGSRFYSPLKDGFPNTRASGIAEDSEKGIWISSDAGLSRVYQGRLHKILDGVADVGISTIARDVLLTVMGPVLGKPGGKTALVRVSKVNGQWKTETVMEPFPSVRLQARMELAIFFLPVTEGSAR